MYLDKDVWRIEKSQFFQVKKFFIWVMHIVDVLIQSKEEL